VKAAILLDPEEQRGVIDYVWTVEGPQPVSKITSPIDYEHYLEKQLKPVCAAISLTLQADFEKLFSNNLQSELF
ncbi:MAG: hypothetical protein HN368_21260, partial [Spirochaetales bacterium]|nr:hypothetical protein [Spirochaetales bacterium]